MLSPLAMATWTRAAAGVLGGGLAAAAALWACSDQTGSERLLGATAPRVEDAGASEETDAAPGVVVDAAGDPLAPILGVWHGVVARVPDSWSILVDVQGGARGDIVGVVTYPSRSCGGTLSWNDGDAGISLHESVSAGCPQEGEDTFTPLSNGELRFEYRAAPGSPVLATGTLSRLATPGASPFNGIWRAGDPNASNLRPLLLTVSRANVDGGVSGVFLLRGATGTKACGAHFQIADRSVSTLLLDEVFADTQADCDGPGRVSLTQNGGALRYVRELDGGTDAGDGGIALERL